MTEHADPIIILDGIIKCYGRNEVLNIPYLALQQREPVLLWGPNTSGKSTLLRLLAGFTIPTRGACQLDRNFRTARRALLPQGGGLYEDLSIRQNLQILSHLHGRSPDPTPFSVLLDESASMYLGAPLGTLSGGMQRIMSIAAMLSLHPDFLFLDEPFGGLDVSYRERLLNILREVGTTIPLLVITEHNPERASAGWRKIALTGGRIRGAP
ncbi:ATP-binding cassette domain-containing protein [Ruegeria lacuscaerulensis]|uniref:ATP-binding cassette domain-containing protein n=1 Tax=Ruegeria lacuscaerulensis TaxID=55218 RepID=UPI00147C74F8|nr:ATP-binding cassette domain-containing protein [Ruegeria lacuscaerulensis]